MVNNKRLQFGIGWHFIWVRIFGYGFYLYLKGDYGPLYLRGTKLRRDLTVKGVGFQWLRRTRG